MSWAGVTPEPAHYRVYRAYSTFDVAALAESKASHFPPPKALLLVNGTVLGTATQYQDTAATPSAAYWYAVTAVDAGGVESALSPLVPVEVTAASAAGDTATAQQRAVTWLLAHQLPNGSWGEPTTDAEDHGRILTTNQALRGLLAAGERGTGVWLGLAFSRGAGRGCNRSAADTFYTLRYSAQQPLSWNAVSELFMRVDAVPDTSPTQVKGWGLGPKYYIRSTPVETALAILVCHERVSFALAPDLAQQLDSALAGQFGWQPGGPPSVFVSSIVYNALRAKAVSYDASWIVTGQTGNGAFGNGAADTAAAVAWLPPLDLDDTRKTNAKSYLRSGQQLDGSWLNGEPAKADPYLTGLCLEALCR